MKKEDKIRLLKQLEAGIITIDQFKASVMPKKTFYLVIYDNQGRYRIDNAGEWISKKEMEAITAGCNILEMPHNGRD